MDINIPLLREKITEKKLTISEFADAIGMNPSTFYRKIEDGGCKFTVGQMHRTVEVLHLNRHEAVSIFLQSNSQ